MAIPNPNPNIADGMKCDNLTWSSNKIAGEVAGAVEEVEAEIPTTEEIQALINTSIADLVNDDVTITLTDPESELSLPNAYRSGNSISIVLNNIIPEGSYSSSTKLYTVDPKPIEDIYELVVIAGAVKTIVVDHTTGDIYISGSGTVTGTQYIRGIINYLI